MPQNHTYLELSENDGPSHKYYEVTVSGTQVSIAYGRIGVPGQTRVSDFGTLDKALAAARKKIDEKLRKGYEPAEKGVRQARPVSRRTMVSSRSTANQAPVEWKFNSGAAAFGIYVGDDYCWVGNQSGDVYKITADGDVCGRFHLPDGVKCLVADDFWIYAGCDDGKVYDLSAKVPRVAYQISPNVDIFWLDVDDAILGVSDRNGTITAIDHEDEFQWSREVTGTDAWMVRCDGEAIYHGHSRGVARYHAGNGNPVWNTRVSGAVLFGWQEEHSVYAGTSANLVYRLAKESGAVEAKYRCDAAVYSCATSPDGRYVFAGDNCSSVYCFDENGRRLWKLGTGCGSAFSMQFHDGKLYLVTTDGSLACLDAGGDAIAAAQAGSVPHAKSIKAPVNLAAVNPSTTVETTTFDGDGVVVECVRQGSKLRMRAISDGYEASWNVQFPKEIREPGVRYVVDGLRESERGGFYRSYGEIRRLR